MHMSNLKSDPVNFFRLPRQLPKILLIIRYVIPPMLVFVASPNIIPSELTDKLYRDSFNEISERGILFSLSWTGILTTYPVLTVHNLSRQVSSLQTLSRASQLNAWTYC